MQDMFETGLRGRLPQFIGNFMKDRQFRVRPGSNLADWHSQETGVPQGCILSVTLFLLKINTIIKCLPSGVRSSLYVDDFVFCYRSGHMRAIERQLQQCLNNLQVWANKNVFRFSESKTLKKNPSIILVLNLPTLKGCKDELSSSVLWPGVELGPLASEASVLPLDHMLSYSSVL